MMSPVRIGLGKLTSASSWDKSQLLPLLQTTGEPEGQGAPKRSRHRMSESPQRTSTAASPTPTTGTPSIASFLHGVRTPPSRGSMADIAGGAGTGGGGGGGGGGGAPDGAAAAAEVDRLRMELRRAWVVQERARREVQEAHEAAEEARHQAAALAEELNRRKDEAEQRKTRIADNLERLMRRVVERDIRESRRQLSESQFRLGRIVPHRTGPHTLIEAWEDGFDLRELQRQQAELTAKKDELERRKRALQRQGRSLKKKERAHTPQRGESPSATTPGTQHTGEGSLDATGADESAFFSAPPRAAAAGAGGDDGAPWLSLQPPTVPMPSGAAGGSAGAASASGGVAAGGGGGSGSGGLSLPPPSASPSTPPLSLWMDLRQVQAEEGVKIQLAALKREEVRLTEERKRLQAEKSLLLRDIKRVRDEEQSRFSARPVLHQRYLLMDLLGKGGFSEVWRALDLLEVREVAVKVHQLSPTWSDAKKQNYVRHATREYRIHKFLKHANVVQLFDVFEIDADSFATVLEYCRGTDLDHLLKQQGSLAEREARAILLQILAALRYLNGIGDEEEDEASGRPKVIHYDIKPQNILFDDSRNVKVTDFGLSKIMDEDAGDSTSMELTSQGAGTYWYLPPECFHLGPTPPRISNKVDVWSVGVLFYQMLYGRRPFGDGQSQEKLLSDKVILKATDVVFPPKPAVTQEAKTFIRRCLTWEQRQRPDVRAICEDPYLRQKMR